MVTAFITGIAIGAILAISVGPVIFSIIRNSVNYGYKAGISFALGVSFSDTLYVVLGNLAGGYISLLEGYKRPIGVGGGVLLLGMGLYSFFFRRISLGSEEEKLRYLRKGDYARFWLGGFLMNSLNPGVILFWVPTIAGISVKFPGAEQRLLLYLTCLGLVLSTDLVKVFLAHRIRHRLTLRMVLVLNRVAGVILMVFGTFLVYKMLFGHGNFR